MPKSEPLRFTFSTPAATYAFTVREVTPDEWQQHRDHWIAEREDAEPTDAPLATGWSRDSTALLAVAVLLMIERTA